MKVRLLKSIDRVFGAALSRCFPAPAVRPLRGPGSVMLIRPGGIGDAVLLIPVIAALKQRFPAASITVLAERRNGAAFGLSPHVSRIFRYDKPGELLQAVRCRYDVVIDTEQWHRLSAVVARLTNAPLSVGFATNGRKRLFSHTITYSREDYEAESFMHLLAPLGIAPSPSGIAVPFIEVPEAARVKVPSLLGELADKPFVTLFSGASIAERRWGADRFAAVAGQIAAWGFPVVVVGGGADVADGERITGSGRYGLNLAGRTSLVETAAVLEKSRLLLSGDSGVLHVGAGLGIPTVSLFGPGIADKWAPRGDRHSVINKYLSCSPCTEFGYTPKCPLHAKCMRDIDVGEVSAVAGRRLGVRC